MADDIGMTAAHQEQAPPADQSLRVRDLHRNHPLVRAGIAMVGAHGRHESMLPALEEVREQFPAVLPSHLILLWVGVNAKAREGLDE